MKYALDPISTPITVPRSRFSALLIGTQSIELQGKLTLATGDWEFAGDDPIGLTIAAETEGVFSGKLTLRGEYVDEETLSLYPEVETLSVELEKSLSYSQSGSTYSLQGWTFASGESGAVENSVELKLADTLVAAVTRLTSQGHTERQTLNSALDLIAELQLDLLELNLVSPTQVAFDDDVVCVSSGVIRIRDARALFSEQEASGQVEAEITLGEGTRFASDGLELAIGQADLALELMVESERKQLSVMPLSAGKQNALTIRSGELRVRSAAISLANSVLTLSSLTIEDADQTLGLNGALEFAQGEVALGAGTVRFARGLIPAFSVHLASTGEDDLPTVAADAIDFEDVDLDFSIESSGRLTLSAKKLTVAPDAGIEAPIQLKLLETRLTMADASGQSLSANSERTTLTLENAEPLVLGQRGELAGTRLAAGWDGIELQQGDNQVQLNSVGVELGVESTEPLHVALTLHASSVEVDDADIGGATVRAAAAEDGAISVAVEIPFTTLQDIIRAGLPSAANLEFSAASLSDEALKSLRLDQSALFGRVKDKLTAELVIEGQHDLDFSAGAGDAIRMAGALSVTMSAVVEQRRVAEVVAALTRTKAVSERESGGFYLARKRISVPVDWTFELGSNAPTSTEELALTMRPSFPEEEPEFWLSRLLQRLLTERSREKPVVIPIGQRFSAQLAALQDMFIHEGALETSTDGFTLKLKATRDR
ncbi:MAG: hypothetical protein AAFU77_00710 [Myxococcota bacterium]